MGSRGRGRFGRGGFGGGEFRNPNPEAFELFPKIELPDRKIITNTKDNAEEMELLRYNIELRRCFKNSPYYFEETLTDEQESMDIERYPDRAKTGTSFGPGSLLSSGFLMLERGYFPAELVQGTKRRVGKKVRWNPKQDLQKLDILEQLEEKHKDQDASAKGKEDEEEDEDDENPEEEEEEESEGDYEQNEDFDDDEDDYNVANEGGGDEDTVY